MGEEMNPFSNNSSTNQKMIPTIGSSVIPTINKLQDIMAPFGSELSGISLPQVAVVGSQSSGKSSVLEALVGWDFLPRGCDICTRRPLRLMLEHCPQRTGEDGREWGEFRHLPGKRFYNFYHIRQEIQVATVKEAGYNRGVSDKEIELKISSPNVLNITLIDLPGITKVPVGDQPSDIEMRIRKMIMAYISQENCIILAVSPANSDLATSDALQIAKAADPTGSRTVGVITKLDIMDRGTDACNFLLGRVVPLRLGYVGVVNRSQEDINKNRSIQEALAHEARFFQEHPVYNGLSNRCGIPQLAKKLNQILEQQVRNVLPCLKAELNSHKLAVEKELQTYGEVMESEVDKGAILLNILRRYCEDFSTMVDGRSQETSTKQLCGGARIYYIFQSVFVKTLEALDPCEDLTDEDIQTAIQNANGLRAALFVPEGPFEVLVRRQIARLLDPCLQCVRFVYDELIKISRACEPIELQRFSALRRRIEEVIRKFLHDSVKPCEKMMGDLIEMEMAYINVSHPNFIGGNKAVELAMQQLKSSQDGTEGSEKGQKARTVVDRLAAALPTQVSRAQTNNDKPLPTGGNPSAKSWAIPSIFGNKASSEGSSANISPVELPRERQQMSPTIQLMQPVPVLRPEMTDHDEVEIIVTKILLKSYFNIVRRNVEDLVPKAIMHYLVNQTKRHLHTTFVHELYRKNLVEGLLQEEDEVVVKRAHAREIYRALEQAVQVSENIRSLPVLHPQKLSRDSFHEPKINRRLASLEFLPKFLCSCNLNRFIFIS